MQHLLVNFYLVRRSRLNSNTNPLGGRGRHGRSRAPPRVFRLRSYDEQKTGGKEVSLGQSGNGVARVFYRLVFVYSMYGLSFRG